MNYFLLGVFIVVAGSMIAPAIWKPDYRLQFPCLLGFASLFQVALPWVTILRQGDIALSAPMERLGMMALFCLVSAWIGYSLNLRDKPARIIRLDIDKATIAAVFLASFGVIITLSWSKIEVQMDADTGGMTGIGTVLIWIANIARYGFVLAAILFFRTRNWVFLFIMAPQILGYIQQFLIGRRSPTAEFLVIICLLLYFYRKWCIPLSMLAAGLFALTMFSNKIGTVRAGVAEGLTIKERIERFVESDPLDVIEIGKMKDDSYGYYETKNAAAVMELVSSEGAYTYGGHFWNRFVFGFVPGQFLGKDFKESLMIPLNLDTIIKTYDKALGSCEPGFAEAYWSFGYFGCFLFFAIGQFMQWLWEGAERNSILHQLLLMLFSLPAAMCFSAGLWMNLNALVHTMIFVGPCIWWSLSIKKGSIRSARRLTGRRMEKSKSEWMTDSNR